PGSRSRRNVAARGENEEVVMLATPAQGGAALDAGSTEFYRRAMATLNAAGIPFLVGGAYSLCRYTGIERHTHDFDVFVRERDCPRALDALARAGYATELTFPHWLGKAFCGDTYVDVIFGSGNGVARVDDLWFEYSVSDEILG